MKQLLSPKDIATLLNCKPSSVYAWAKEGKIPAFKLNGLLRFDFKEIEEWIKSNRISPSASNKTAARILNRAKNVDVDAVIRKAVDSHVKSKS